jgi:hypothetical protein
MHAVARHPIQQRLRDWQIARAMAPINIGGDAVDSITIDGQDVQEVTVGGETVYQQSAIPDSDNLHARYDFSQEDGTLPIIDRTGNGYDLDQGQYSGVSASINGVQAGVFDGGDDAVYYGSSFSDIRPLSVFAVVKLDGPTDADQFIVSGNATDFVVCGWQGTSLGEWYARFGSTVSGGADDTDTLVSLIDAGGGDASSQLRTDGVERATGDLGTGAWTTHALVFALNTSDRYWIGRIGEVLIYYKVQDASTRNEIELYLANKWGVY